MRADALEVKIHLIIRERAGTPDTCLRPGVPREHGISAVKYAFTRHERFSGSALLSWASEELYRGAALALLQEILQADRSGERPGGEGVMPASMTVSAFGDRFFLKRAGFLAQVRQRVVLSQYADHRASASVGRDERMIHPSHAALYFEPFFCQHRRKQAGGSRKVKARLGKTPVIVADARERVRFCINQRGEPVLVIVVRNFCHLRIPVTLPGFRPASCRTCRACTCSRKQGRTRTL